MEEERLPRNSSEWCPPERRGTPQNPWMQEDTTGMRERETDNLEWVDREEWRRKIKTLGTERSENIKNLYI